MLDPSRMSPEQVAQLVQQAAIQQQALVNRGRVHMGELLDALACTCMAAESGDPVAKADLQAFLQTLERAKTAAAGVVSANGVHLAKG